MGSGWWLGVQRTGGQHHCNIACHAADNAFCYLSTLSAADNDDPALAAGTTAAWALSNVLKGAGREVGEVRSRLVAVHCCAFRARFFCVLAGVIGQNLGCAC